MGFDMPGIRFLNTITGFVVLLIKRRRTASLGFSCLLAEVLEGNELVKQLGSVVI